jgi:hypothetical protein
MKFYILNKNEKQGLDYSKLSFTELSKKQLEELGESRIESLNVEKFGVENRVPYMLQEDLDILQVTVNKIAKVLREYNIDLDAEIERHNAKVIDQYGWEACGVLNIDVGEVKKE